MLFATTVSAQTDVKKNIDIDFYGVDFSLAQVTGAKETPAQFIQAFDGINMLILGEAKKYDIAKFFNKRDVAVNLVPAMTMNKGIDQLELMAGSSNKTTLSAEQIAAQIKKYDLDPKYDTGMVIIAQTLDKSNNHGYFHVVFFDNKTREVLYSKVVSGKAGGFGVRNFWAGSLYNVFNAWKW